MKKKHWIQRVMWKNVLIVLGDTVKTNWSFLNKIINTKTFIVFCCSCTIIDEKTNDISTTQELLKLMDLKGTIVTADALNCQKDTVSAIVGSKGNYVLALKGNQLLFCEEVQGFFDEEKKKRSGKARTGIKRPWKRNMGDCTERILYHGRREKQWKKLKAFGMVHKTLTEGKEKEEEYRYYLCSIR